MLRAGSICGAFGFLKVLDDHVVVEFDNTSRNVSILFSVYTSLLAVRGNEDSLFVTFPVIYSSIHQIRDPHSDEYTNQKFCAK